jgi:hypothetical protein
VVGAENVSFEPGDFLVLAIGFQVEILETKDDTALCGLQAIHDTW